MIDRAYMLHDVVKPEEDLYKCRACNTIYRSAEKNPKCPKGMERCAGVIQRATARYVG